MIYIYMYQISLGYQLNSSIDAIKLLYSIDLVQLAFYELRYSQYADTIEIIIRYISPLSV